MTNREHIRQQLSAYIDGELDAVDAAAVEQALACDAELTRELEQFKATRELLRCLPVEHAPEDFASRVLAQTERRHLVHLHAPARQGINWLRYSVTAAVALIAVSVALVTVVGIYSAHNAGRNMFAGKPAVNAPAAGEGTIALLDKTGSLPPGKDGELRSATEHADRKVEEGQSADNNVLICTDDLPKARRELESELGKNSIQYKAHWSGDEEAVVVADVDSSQVSRLNTVISNMRLNNIGAELSGRELRRAKCDEQAKAADLKTKSTCDKSKGADVATKEGQKRNDSAKEEFFKPGGGHGGSGKLAENESTGMASSATAHNDGDGGRLAKNLQPHLSPAKPSASITSGTAGPTTRPAFENNAAPVLANNDPCEHSAKKAPQSAAMPPGATAQIATATSRGQFDNLRNQSNQLALRVQITLQYHPALTQGFGAAQNRSDGQAGQNLNQSSQSCPADNAASTPDNSQQTPNR